MSLHARIVSIAPIVLAAFLLLPFAARAQMRMAPVGGPRPVFRPIHVQPSAAHGVVVPRARINTAAPSTAHSRIGTVPSNVFGNTNTFDAGAGETLQQLLDPVPGPGFNYAHVAALDRDLAIKAVIDPQTQWSLAVAERVLRDTGGFASPGYYLLDGGAYIVPESSPSAEPPQQTPQPQIIVLQQPAPKTSEESAAAAAPQPSAPIPDVGNFTLVLRDGKKIQAIAFTRAGDRIVYITADGARHTIAKSELDTAATERVNQDSGTQFTL
jgi:hypothetical protein